MGDGRARRHRKQASAPALRLSGAAARHLRAAEITRPRDRR
jgi:hypothetical protein